MSKYNLNDLGSQNFEHLVQALLKKEIGSGTITFGTGPDGGREATYSGIASLYPSETEQWDGEWIFQAKIHDTKDIDKDRSAVINDLGKELNKIVNKYKHKCDNYILATNVSLTSVHETGNHDKIEKIKEQYRSNIPNIAVWGYDDICKFLDNNIAVREAYLGVGTIPEEYLESLEKKYKSEGIFKIEGGITLEKLFVMPEVEVFREKQKEKSGHANAIIKEYLEKERVLIIESYYGIGKSSLCLNLSVEAIEEWLKDNNKPFPIYLELKRYDNQTLKEFVKTQTGLVINNDLQPYIFFLDGFDELKVFGQNENLDMAKELLSIRKLQEWCEEYNNSKFIIATRPTDKMQEHSWEEYKIFPLCKIQKFDDKKNEKWVDNWNKHNSSQKVDFKIIKGKVKEDILGIPIFLYFLAFSYKELGIYTIFTRGDETGDIEIEDPEFRGLKNATTIYEAFFQATRKGNFKGKHNWWVEIGLTDDESIVLLQEIAYLISSSGNGYITIEDLRNKLQPGKLKNAINKLESKGRLDDIFLCYFFQQKEKGVEFANQSMLEFLTARYFKENPEKLDILLDYLTDYRWHEVFIFTTEMLKNNNTFLQKMQIKTNSLIANNTNIVEILKFAKIKVDSIKNIKGNLDRIATMVFYIHLCHDVGLAQNEAYSFRLNIHSSSYIEIKLDNALYFALETLKSPYYSFSDDYDTSSEREYFLKECLKEGKKFSTSLGLIELNHGLESIERNLEHAVSENQMNNLKEDLKSILKEFHNFNDNLVWDQLVGVTIHQYKYANKLIIDCLRSSCSLTNKVKEQILDKLLLP